MGCDIHLFVERRTDAGWQHVPNPDTDDYADPQRWYHGRNYRLFSILADVRNGVGFAGVRTGDGFVPISAPRGLPLDVSVAVATECDEWGIDGHSHSHLTVAEILAFDWDQMATLTGLVHDKGDDDPRWKGGGRAKWAQEYADRYHELPSTLGEYCAGVSGPSEHLYKRITWSQPYYRCASNDWWGTVARAARLSKGSLDDVRFVFWFDN